MRYSAGVRACRCEAVLIVVCAVGVAAAPLPARARSPAEAPAVEPPEGPGREAPPAVPPRPRRGLGVLIPGVPISVLGVVGLGIGGAFLFEDLDAVCADEPCPPAGRGLSFFGASIFFSGLLVFASGAAMTAVGAVRHHRYRRWQAQQVGLRWTPGLARSAHGTWVAGLGLRF